MEPEFTKISPNLPIPGQEKKKNEWKNIIAIVFLVLLPIVGLILMWLLATWSKKTKIIVTVVLLIGWLSIMGIQGLIVWRSLGKARERAKEARAMAEMMHIRTAAEIIDVEEGSYNNVNCNYPPLVLSCTEINQLIGRKPTIYSFQDAYCGYIKLLNGNYFCVDSTGSGKKTTIYPGGIGYCDGITFICPK